jgi:probable F420-dependent oxidoreductase
VTGRPFRFGVVASRAGSGEEWAATARRVESLGYSTLAMPDRLQHTLAPIPALAAAAAATSRLRVGTYVIANDFRDPVLLAKETATLDLLSGGRFELGVGIGLAAGASADGRMLGLAPASARERTERLAEAMPLVKALWKGRAVIAGGRHYVARDAEVSPSPTQRPRPPILVAAWSRRLLELAAREADIVALGVPPA